MAMRDPSVSLFYLITSHQTSSTKAPIGFNSNARCVARSKKEKGKETEGADGSTRELELKTTR